MKKRMLLAFVEQLGHDHEVTMEIAMVETADDDIPESNPSCSLALLLVCNGMNPSRNYGSLLPTCRIESHI